MEHMIHYVLIITRATDIVKRFDLKGTFKGDMLHYEQQKYSSEK